MFFKKNKRIKELEKKVLELQQELEETMELASDTYIKLQAYEEMDDVEIVDKCDCGEIMKPMYEEHPNWITFCSKCDGRNENTLNSPISEPA